MVQSKDIAFGLGFVDGTRNRHFNPKLSIPYNLGWWSGKNYFTGFPSEPWRPSTRIPFITAH